MSRNPHENRIIDWVFGTRLSSDRQSQTNPIQQDRIESKVPLHIEVIAPKANAADALLSFTRFLFFPLVAVAWYSYLIVPRRDTTWHFIFSEAIGFLIGGSLFVLYHPVARYWLFRLPALWLPVLVALPFYFAFDSIYLRLHIAIFAGVVFSDLLARQSIWLGTGLPISPERRLMIRQCWVTRLWPSKTQVPGFEFYWLQVAAILSMPVILVMFWPIRLNATVPGISHFVLAITALFLIPWLVEHCSAYLFRRRAVGFFQMIKGYHLAIYEWVTYKIDTPLTPGVITPCAGRILMRRRLYWGSMLLMITAITPIHIFVSDMFLTWRFDQGRGLVLDNFSNLELEGNLGERVVRAKPEPKKFELQPYQWRMYERMGPEQKDQFFKRQVTEYQQSTLPQGRLKNGGYSLEIIDPDLNFFTKRALESLPPKIRDRIFEFGPYVLSIVSPFALFYAIGFAVASRAVTTYPIRRVGQIDANALSHNSWNQIVHELKRSPTTVNSLFLGFNAADNSPIIVPREVFQEHAHLLGDTGSGKTSLGLGPLITQLIRMKDLSVVVVDMKGDDLALMQGTKLEAENAGLRFRWFSNELDRPTYTFNPLAQQAFQKLSIYQRTDILLNALGLQYGTDYGKAYFSDANAQMLFHAMKAKPTARSFQELVGVLRNPSNFVHVSKAIVRDGSHLMAIIERLASFAPLNTLSTGNKTPDQVFTDSIDFKSVFEQPEVLYFHLSSPLGTASSAEMARLALYGILSAAKAAQGTRGQVILVIDEFQRIIAKNLELFLQTARSFNIGVVLANQSLRDLKSNDFDLASTVKTNCRFKQYFSVSDPMEIAELSKSSGDTLIHNRSTSLGGQALSFLVGRYLYDTMTFTEQQVPRLSTNQILLAGDNPKQSIVQLRRGAGYAQFGGFPFVLSGTHHISIEEYERRKLLPWPDPTEGTITPSSTEEISQPNEITGPLFFDSPLLTDAKTKTTEQTLFPETKDDAKTWRKSIRNKKKPKNPD